MQRREYILHPGGLAISQLPHFFFLHQNYFRLIFCLTQFFAHLGIFFIFLRSVFLLKGR